MGDSAECVVTVDLLTNGVDFNLAEAGACRIGRKALAVNLSDLAAMAARPLGAVIALALPRNGALELAQGIYEGLLPLAERFHVAIAGGDTNTWDGPLAISVTLIGDVPSQRPLLRGGAQPGDQILVTGAYGGSILGRHFDFEPRVSEALLLNEQYLLHAGIDASDGLSLDVSRIAAESGCGAVIETAKIPIAAAADELARKLADGSTALEHALADGEDFELILAVPPKVARDILADCLLDVPVTRIGEFVAQPGLWQVGADGNRQPLAPRGYEH